MKFTKVLYPALVLILTFTSVFAQKENDLASWTSLQLGYDLDDNWDLGLEGQFRLKSNISVVDEYFSEFFVRRKLLKGFRIALALRYIRENDNIGRIQGYENHFRFHIDADYKHKLGDIRLGYRLRYQNKRELGVSDDQDNFPINRLRFKTGVEYKIKNWPLDPELAVELFSRFEKNEDTELDKYRITLGTSYSFKKAGDLGVYYRRESDINNENSDNQHIIGLKYKYTFENL
ncbi:DUF2490 domain-containing protein [Maribacter algarum]|uniref:DUF2490 domain-containing protein n=1 Tax=Maribacter algarum (ex Zhang et al. 2020) TaxID=2578118 RepID=A0A5S3PRG6_9FLAO|nr:DUF2490 domain-containing protein [Maribacter algarum]TMM57330.1 DUF2490 domain-containing protein [Maribacter algarum]